jgi:CVNH domain-containing protein
MMRLALGALALAACGVASAEPAAPPAGSYTKSCEQIVVGEDNLIRASCRTTTGAMLKTSLALPCKGSIENRNGSLHCAGENAADAPRGPYLKSCSNAVVKDGVLQAWCTRINMSGTNASLKLPCKVVDNRDGRLVCLSK